jgi:hypothetical protein
MTSILQSLLEPNVASLRENLSETQEQMGGAVNLKLLGVLQLAKTKKSVALVHERTIPIKRPPLVGEVSANFCG